AYALPSRLRRSELRACSFGDRQVALRARGVRAALRAPGGGELMAQHHEIFAMILGGRRMDLHKGFIVELSRDAEIFARIRVETLEDANQLEAIAARVEGSWMPNYRYEGKALSVTEFVEKVTNDPKAFSQPLAVEKPKKAPAPTPSKPGRPSSASALDKIRSF